jgi:glycosyltransferase involved in cell wall biosynthesis
LDIRLDIVGSLTVNPLYAQEMKQQVIAHGLQSKVFFHGILDDEALAGILRQAHVLVIPSFYEGFGIAYLEGMAFGLPAIGTRAGAIPQLVIDKENGFLINPGDSEALTKCLQALRVDQELLIRLSMNALRYFQSQPTWAQAMESIRNFLLSNTGARRSQST